MYDNGWWTAFASVSILKGLYKVKRGTAHECEVKCDGFVTYERKVFTIGFL
ncbi:hypothetical protein EMIT079MI2_10399 [Bacillus sp. IT-79MI2]|nr:hypothetical protein BTH41_00259 [Bacillus mycoides]